MLERVREEGYSGASKALISTTFAIVLLLSYWFFQTLAHGFKELYGGIQLLGG